MKYQKSYVQNLGPEHHMKSWVDGFWGDFDSRLKEAEVSQPLSELEDLQRFYEQAYHSLPQPRPSEHSVCFMPNIERDVFAASRPLVLLASLPAYQKSCYSYSFTRTDVARRSKCLLGKDRQTVTAMRVVAHRVPNRRGVAEYTSTKVQLNQKLEFDPAAPDETALEDGVGNIDIVVLLCFLLSFRSAST